MSHLGAKPRNGPRASGRQQLTTINWGGEEMPAIQKVFMVEHPEVECRTLAESNQIRLRANIAINNLAEGVEIPKPIDCFAHLPFPDWIIEQLNTKGFREPTPIQVQAWPAALNGHDIVGIAETGSGKTLAYVCPMLMHIMQQMEVKPHEGPVGLVLLPSRELCQQVQDQIDEFQRWTNMKCVSIVGGSDQQQQERSLLGRVDVMVATPGRLISLLNSQATNLKRASYVVFDEADQLVGDTGESSFVGQIKMLVSQIRPDRQVLLFSATWHHDVENLSRDICSCSPMQVVVGGTTLSACRNVKQNVRRVESGRSKLEALYHLLCEIKAHSDDKKILVFCNRAEDVKNVVGNLKHNGIPCEGFAKDVCRPEERTRLLQKFTEPCSISVGEKLNILVCTQVLGRGHDFKELEYVVNYDMPSQMVEYVHRVGRTGRAGRKGEAFSLFEDRDLAMAKAFVEVLRETHPENIPDWLWDAANQRLCGELRFTCPDACTAAIKASPHRLGGAVIRAEAYKQSVDDTKVFLKGIPQECSVRTLKNHFEVFGDVAFCRTFVPGARRNPDLRQRSTTTAYDTEENAKPHRRAPDPRLPKGTPQGHHMKENKNVNSIVDLAGLQMSPDKQTKVPKVAKFDEALDRAEKGERVIVITTCNAVGRIRILRRHPNRPDLVLGAECEDEPPRHKKWIEKTSIEVFQAVKEFAPSEDWEMPEAYLKLRIGDLLIAVHNKQTLGEGFEDYIIAARHSGGSNNRAKGVVPMSCLCKVVLVLE